MNEQVRELLCNVELMLVRDETVNVNVSPDQKTPLRFRCSPVQHGPTSHSPRGQTVDGRGQQPPSRAERTDGADGEMLV